MPPASKTEKKKQRTWIVLKCILDNDGRSYRYLDLEKPMKVSKEVIVINQCKLMSLETLAMANSARLEATQLEFIEMRVLRLARISQLEVDASNHNIRACQPVLRLGTWKRGLGTQAGILALKRKSWLSNRNLPVYGLPPVHGLGIAPRGTNHMSHDGSICYSLNNFSFKVSSFHCLWILVPTAPYLVSIVQSGI